MDRLAGVLGVAGVAAGLGFPVYFGGLDPAYDPMRDFISEMGAAGAPNAPMVNWMAFLPTGLIQIAFALCAWIALPRSGAMTLGIIGWMLFSLGYVAAAVFPCDTGCMGDPGSFSQQMHFALGVPGYFLAPASALMLAFAARQWPGGQWISVVALLSAVGGAASLSALAGDFDGNMVGLWQRMLEASVMIPMLAISTYLLVRRPA
jgi:hypothetical membrane protein